MSDTNDTDVEVYMDKKRECIVFSQGEKKISMHYSLAPSVCLRIKQIAKKFEHQPMSYEELVEAMKELDLPVQTLADYLGVSHATVYAWIKSYNPVGKSAGEAIKGWLKLHRAGIPWKP